MESGSEGGAEGTQPTLHRSQPLLEYFFQDRELTASLRSRCWAALITGEFFLPANSSWPPYQSSPFNNECQYLLGFV